MYSILAIVKPEVRIRTHRAYATPTFKRHCVTEISSLQSRPLEPLVLPLRPLICPRSQSRRLLKEAVIALAADEQADGMLLSGVRQPSTFLAEITTSFKNFLQVKARLT